MLAILATHRHSVSCRLSPITRSCETHLGWVERKTGLILFGELTSRSLNKLDVGKQIRILNTTQNWVVSEAFRSMAIALQPEGPCEMFDAVQS